MAFGWHFLSFYVKMALRATTLCPYTICGQSIERRCRKAVLFYYGQNRYSELLISPLIILGLCFPYFSALLGRGKGIKAGDVFIFSAAGLAAACFYWNYLGYLGPSFSLLALVNSVFFTAYSVWRLLLYWRVPRLD